jgi:Tfp pilus assembly protein PilF
MMISGSLKRRICLLFFLTVPVCLVYSNTLDVPFYFDDHRNIAKNEHIRLTRLSLNNLIAAAFDSPLSQRPIANITFALNHYIHGNDLAGYHVVNILIHVTNGILVYLLVLSILSTPAMGHAYKPQSVPIALVGALIWLLHPIQTQSVTYVVQRMNSLATLFYLSSLLLFAKARQTDSPGKAWAWIGGCVIAGILALATKEIAATLPFFILLYEWYFVQDLDTSWLKRRLPHILAVLGLIVFVTFLFTGPNPLVHVLASYGKRDFTLMERVLTQTRVILNYISLLAFPHPSRLTLLHEVHLSSSLISPMTTLFSVFSISGLLVLGIITTKQARLVSFGILFFFGNLLIESSIIGLEIMFEHRTYLPSVGFTLSVTVILFRLISSKGIRIPVFASVLVLLSIGTFKQNQLWGNPALLLENAVRKYPTNARAYNNLANVYVHKGDYKRALENAKKALALNSELIAARVNMGVILARLGELEKAVTHYQTALELAPNFVGAHYNLANVWARLGNPSKAARHYSLALELEPKDPDIHNNLGIVLARMGKTTEAVAHFQKALDIQPNFEAAKMNLKDCLEASTKIPGLQSS